jgi:glycosyltransferase involved in cell wall biosynthesis
MLTAVMRADRFICVSRFTLNQMRERFPRRSRKAKVVWNGIGNPTLDREEAEEIVKGLGIQYDYVMWIGYLNPRKNPNLVAKAAAGLQLPLVTLMPRGTALPGAKLSLSGVSARERDALLRCARCLLFPSVCEGFGFPVAEAMRQGCPPLGLAGTVVEELTGGIIEHPYPDVYLDAARDLVANGHHLEDRLIERSRLFSEERNASETWTVISQV